MRIVDLRLVETPGSTLGLHPSFSVVTGVSTSARRWLGENLAALLSGGPAPIIALVEQDGATSEIHPGGPPILTSRVDYVVRASDLPHTAAGRSRPGLDLDDDLRRSRAARATAMAPLTALELAAREAQKGHSRTMAALTHARAAIVQARRDLDPYAAAGLDAAVATAARVEVELGLGPGACRADTLESTKDRIVLLEAQHRDIDAALEMLAGADPEPVAAALDVVRVVTADGPIVPAEALRLADDWSSISEHLSAIEAKFAADEGGVQSVSDRLEAARLHMHTCETTLAPPTVKPEDVAALEAAHEEVLAAERKASGRLGGSRARRSLDEALAEEQIYLDRLGYPTWSSWIMGAPLLDATAENARAIEQARRELADATFAWDRLTAKLEADPEFRQLLDHLEQVLEAAHAIVGDVDDVEQALRDVRVDPGPAPCSVSQARSMLADALAAAGVDGGSTLDQLRVNAERWLAEIRTVSALRRQLEIDNAQCLIELARAQDTFERIEALGPAEPGDGFGSGRVKVTRTELIAAEDRVIRHRAAITRVAHLVAEAEAIAELERQMRQATEAKQELLAMTRGMVDSAESRVRTLEAAGGWQAPSDEEESVIEALDARRTAIRLAADGTPVPLVLDEALDGLSPDATETVLGWLEAISADTQVILLTEQPHIVAWAGRRNPARVARCDGSSLTSTRQ